MHEDDFIVCNIGPARAGLGNPYPRGFGKSLDIPLKRPINNGRAKNAALFRSFLESRCRRQPPPHKSQTREPSERHA
jgi:hypothetical protein